MSWTMPWMKSQSGPVDKKCPNCGAGNPAKASRCSGCSLDFKFLGFVMKILTGAYPEAECNPDILTPGEVAHFSARISVTELRDKAHLDQGYGASKHVLAKRPCSGSFNFLATGLLVATNHRILILSGGEICSIPWEEIRQFDLDATSVRIFHQGRYSGDICHLDDTRALWWIYYAKLHLEPDGRLLNSPDLNDAPEYKRLAILSVMSQMEEARENAQDKARAMKTRLQVALVIMFWMILIPPYGFRLLFVIGWLGAYVKTGLFLFGLCSAFSWMLLMLKFT